MILEMKDLEEQIEIIDMKINELKLIQLNHENHINRLIYIYKYYFNNKNNYNNYIIYTSLFILINSEFIIPFLRYIYT